MKSLLLLAILFTANVSYAAVFKCTNQVTPLRTEFAYVETWPHMQLSTSFEECTEGGGLCMAGPLDEIVSDKSVCFQFLNLENDCNIFESNVPGYPKLEVNCNGNANVLMFDTDAGNHGKAVCYENMVMKKTWDLGTCIRE